MQYKYNVYCRSWDVAASPVECVLHSVDALGERKVPDIVDVERRAIVVVATFPRGLVEAT